jgi:basic membrane lipoprotein Med (substrate-binding protein (PBP1-ABC) superfamily)
VPFIQASAALGLTSLDNRGKEGTVMTARSDAWSRRGVLTTAMAGALAAGTRASRAANKLKVAAVHASPVENAWNSRLQEALRQAADEGRIDYVFSEGVANTDYPRAMREYAGQGAKLIVGEAYAVEREARQVAKDFPQTAFLMGSSGGPAGQNFGVFGTWNHEAAYLTGLLAGHMGKTGTYGAVGGYPIPEVNRLVNAFRLGVREGSPNARFLVGFIGTWFDPAKAKEAALAQIDAGADILFGERIGTADAAKERGKLAIGSLLDYTPRYPKTVFANAMWYFGPILDHALADVSEGKPAGRDYSEYSFMKYGGNDCIYAKDLVPPEAAALMQAKRKEIKDGTFKVPVDDSKPA